jgi:phosphonate transport system substrate-binding protein
MPTRPAIRALAAGLIATTTLALGACSDDGSSSDKAIRFAVTDLQGLEELQREFGDFADVLAESTGYEIEFFAVGDRTAAAAALEGDQVDLVFTGPAEYVVFHERLDVTPVIGISRQNYASCISTTGNSELASVAELAGKKISMTDVGSTSGHLGPSQILVDNGLEPGEDVAVITAGDAAHEALKRGDVDAAGLRCTDLDDYMEEDGEDAYKLLARGDDLPADLILARNGVDQEVIDTVKAAFEDNWEELLAAMLVGDDNSKYEGATLSLPDDADYDIVRSMYRAIGVDDFTEFVG